MKTIKYGVIGCGMMGQEHLANIALLEGAEVAAVYEPDPQMAEAARQRVPEAFLAESLEDLLHIEDLDCLLVASPNHVHKSQLSKIAELRPLPLLIEKPLFTDPADADAVRKIGKSYPAPIWVAMEYRYMPPVALLLERAASVTGGVKMLTIREHRFPFLPKVGDWNRFNANTGGTFVEKCCHFFDLMRLVMKDEPVRIYGSGGQAVNHLEESYDGATPDIADHGYVMVEFARGGRAMLELCMFAEGAEYQEEISAVGHDGKIEAFVPGPGRFWPTSAGAAPLPKVVESPRMPKSPTQKIVPVDANLLAAGDHNGSTFYQHQKFLRLVQGQQTSPDVSIRDGWIAVLMGQAAQASMETGMPVDLDFS